MEHRDFLVIKGRTYTLTCSCGEWQNAYTLPGGATDLDEYLAGYTQARQFLDHLEDWRWLPLE